MGIRPSRASRALAAVGAFLLIATACGSDDAGPTSTSPPTTSIDATTSTPGSTTTTESPEEDPESLALQQEALDRIDAFFNAVNSGNVDAMPDILGEPLSEARRRHFEFHAMFKATGVKWVPGTCEAQSVIGTFVTVECPMQNQNPVFVATGASSVIAPFQLRGDILRESSWVSLEVGFDSPDGPLRAMVEYLETFYPEDYVFCDPDTQTGEFTEHGGIARVPECAEVLAPLLDDIAAWVDAERPSDWDG